MRLVPAEFNELHDALSDAFPTYNDLALTLRRGGWQIQNIAAPGVMGTVVLHLIEYTESRDRVHELVAAARAANPDNVKLLTVAAALGLEPGGVPHDTLRGDTALAEVKSHLERMVDAQRGIADLGSFAAKIQELLRQVCALEVGPDRGTGFLIGPETILTNYHVVEKAIKEAVDPASVVVRFDYQRLRDGKTTNAGVTFGLASDWLVHAEKYSPVDTQPYDEVSLPAVNELDYAVLRTATKVGEATASGPAGAQRGWVTPLTYAYDFPVDSFLIVVQHPCNDPISFDDVDNAVIRVNPNGTRVHYRTNTMPGSSGSPVLNRNLDLVALHHAGEPGSPDWGLECQKQIAPASYNEGVPIAKIQAHLTKQHLSWVFGSPKP